MSDTPAPSPRRWTVYDASEDYNPRWEIGDGTPPPALEYAEEVVVMPVAERRAEVERLRQSLEMSNEAVDGLTTELVRLRDAAQAVVDTLDRSGAFSVHQVDALREALAPGAACPDPTTKEEQ